MKIKRLRSHPRFRLEGRSQHFQSCWELELSPGEETSPHRHYESEELLYLISGLALVTVEQTQREVSSGEVVLIPPRHCHKILNPSHRVVHAISVESRLDLADGEQPSEEELEVLDKARLTLPEALNEGQAIEKLIEIFNIGGRLSEQIERAGQDEDTSSMSLLEQKVMKAVLEIAERYRDDPAI